MRARAGEEGKRERLRNRMAVGGSVMAGGLGMSGGRGTRSAAKRDLWGLESSKDTGKRVFIL